MNSQSQRLARKRSRLIALALICAAIALRLFGLQQYPLVNPDEGFWATGPRNLMLFGEPLMDGRLHPFLSPAHFAVLSGWFGVFQIDLLTARMFSVFVGVLTCATVMAWARVGALRRPELVALVFAFCSSSMLLHRVALLEAHQMFWLSLAAFFWLKRGRGGAFVAGMAMGVALLVKSNSVYLLPVFALTVPRTNEALDWRAPAAFVSACLLIAGAGYLAAMMVNPTAFSTAFTYELDGLHFLDEGVLFHLGRFGLHPARLFTAVQSFLKLDPVLLALSTTGLVMSLRRRHALTPAVQFAVLWVLFGMAFHFSQIYVEVRYLGTMAPALALLATVPLDRAWDSGAPTSGVAWKRGVVVSVVALLCLTTSARVALVTWREPNTAYWSVVHWVRANVPAGTVVMAAPSLGLSFPQRSYDYFRLVRPYSGGEQPFGPIVDSIGARVFVIDDEWRHFATEDIHRFIARETTVLFAADGIEVRSRSTRAR